MNKYKLNILLERRYGIQISTSTIGRILNRYKSHIPKPRGRYFIKKRITNRNKNKIWAKDIELEGKPLELIQIDTRHYIELGKRKAYLYVAIDVKTRLAFTMFYKEITSKTAAVFLDRVINYFRGYGKIKYIQTDNGSEYPHLVTHFHTIDLE